MTENKRVLDHELDKRVRYLLQELTKHDAAVAATVIKGLSVAVIQMVYTKDREIGMELKNFIVRELDKEFPTLIT